jgi:hypothetical protein
MATATEKTAAPDTLSELTNQLVGPAVQAGSVSTEAYLNALDVIADLQRRLTEGTPLELFAGLLTAQTQATRQLLEAYLQVGKQESKRVEDATSRAGRSGAEAAESTRRAVTKTARKLTEAVTGPADPPIAGYDSMTAEQVVAKLPELAQTTLAKVEAYEKSHQSRATVLERIGSLRGDEPAPGYDELTVDDIQKVLADEGDTELAGRVRDYERRHKGRSTVLQAAERQLNKST